MSSAKAGATLNKRDFEAHMRDQAIAFVTRAQIAGQRELQEILGPQWGARTGRDYKRGNRIHKASSPGEPAAVDTGRLRRSAVTHSLVFKGNAVIGAIGIATDYAEHLEVGTERMAPRPAVVRLEEQDRAQKIGRIAAQALK